MRHGKRINKYCYTPTANADATKVLQTYSFNINVTEVGHSLGKVD